MALYGLERWKLRRRSFATPLAARVRERVEAADVAAALWMNRQRAALVHECREPEVLALTRSK
jgi:hypothetical protein